MSLIDQAKITPLTSLQTTAGKEALYKGFERISTNKKLLETRGNTILLLRKFLLDHPDLKDNLTDQFKIVKENEEVFKDFGTKTEQSWQEKTSEQIFFAKGGPGEMLNQIPNFIALLTFIKIWLAPIFGVASPLLLCILPYFMLVYVYKFEISWSYYQTIILDTFIGQERSFNFNTISKVLYFIISISQTVIQPFFTSIAVSKLDTLVRDRANKIKQISQATDTIVKIFSNAKIRVPKLISLTGDSYCIFAQDKDEPWKLQYLKTIVGYAEVIFCLATDHRFRKPVWSNNTCLEIREFSDIAITKPILSSVKFSAGKTHSLLTGPNRGGKSSSLRGILQNVLWAQCYGVTPSFYKGSIFHSIDCSLRAEDRPGISSLFEREIEIATSILRKKCTADKKGLVLIDEIFHSTNPPDGERTARIFLEALWRKQNVISCVSTHVYSLVESAPDSIQTLCCNATENEDGSVNYDYKLTEGICKVSSVIDVLREKGFLVSATAAAAK